MKQYGVLLLSCVRHQRDYAPYIAAHPRLKIVAVADEPGLPDWMRKANSDMAAHYGVPCIEDVDAALARADVQLTSVCPEPTRHARLAEQAARAGKHVLVDKPMATTLADADALIAAVEQSGVKLTYVHRLFSPSTQLARRAILDGKLGLPWALHIDFLSGGGLGSGAVEDFRLVVDRTLSGGGEMMNFLVYPVGYLRFLTGLEIVSVYAAAGTFFAPPMGRRGSGQRRVHAGARRRSHHHRWSRAGRDIDGRGVHDPHSRLTRHAGRRRVSTTPRTIWHARSAPARPGRARPRRGTHPRHPGRLHRSH